ncbi:ScpA/B protein [Limosilactobacillus coleohominis 101-4-CHN]|uniref:Segregation and condensation protein A n=1 Tax=Limosilactobacillus coleohominis 101-4-CHN TaxID=575594 RepID=C7XU27_9LACO|nr:segregation/condensation protein A [Limosilactobacillus coleohominis]EEU30788.1 ScpA/B protein [Limosilactobacillus coleohominis 101-4-CHN]
MAEAELVNLPYQPTLKLNEFEGPLDLLLHLIRQSKMDIYDIKIAEITDQYMKYLAENQRYRLEIAGDYFVMAATLMAIKSQMLLPSPPADEEENSEPEEDPRAELVEQLLEYQRYKKAAENLKDKEEQRQMEYTREAAGVPDGFVQEQVAPGVTIDQLQAAFAKILARYNFKEPEIKNVRPERITVAERIQAVVHQVTKPVRFVDLFQDDVSRDNLITTFMAVLELTRHEIVKISQTTMFGPLIVIPGPRNEEYRNEQSS